MGAGEQMARLAESGSSRPALVTLFIAFVLSAWSLYGLSGAGVVFRRPLLRAGLITITAVYSIRGFAFLPLMTLIPGRCVSFYGTLQSAPSLASFMR